MTAGRGVGEGEEFVAEEVIGGYRLLKVDTIFSYDPWGHYEENPDHYVTAQCVESACWMAGGRLDYPEHFAAGLAPYGVREKYYFARGPQLVNRVVDISSTIDKKMSVIRANRTMIKNMVGQLKQSLAARNLRLPALERDDLSRTYGSLAMAAFLLIEHAHHERTARGEIGVIVRTLVLPPGLAPEP